MRVPAAIALTAVLATPTIVGAAPPPGERGEPALAELLVKPTGPIAVEYRLASQPEVGVPLEIAVTARVEAEVSSLEIDAAASAPNAVLVTPPTLVASGDGVYTWRLTVVPLAVEAGYLSVIVEGTVDGLAQARNVTVALRSAAAAKPQPAAAAPNREVLIALPVQETP